MFEIKRMTIEDYEKIYSFWISIDGVGLNSLDDSKNGIEKYLLRNPKTCFIAKINREIVGTIMCGNDGRRGYIHHTAVSNSMRRVGIGKKLVDAAITGLIEEGINKVALVVFQHNKTGNMFWDSIGFYRRKDLVYRDKIITVKEMIYN